MPEILEAGGIEAAAKARTLVAAALKDRSPELRFMGITRALREDLNMLPAIIPLLDDQDSRIRHAALLALGPIREKAGGAEKPLVDTDSLLRFLHDPDPAIQQLCETILIKSRQLRHSTVRYGRMLTDPQPQERLKLLLALANEENIDHRVWLQRLSEDSNAAVRAGAARVAVEKQIDFGERLQQMIHEDPDETVRKIASYYAHDPRLAR